MKLRKPLSLDQLNHQHSYMAAFTKLRKLSQKVGEDCWDEKGYMPIKGRKKGKNSIQSQKNPFH